jgi:hypothetical protein
MVPTCAKAMLAPNTVMKALSPMRAIFFMGDLLIVLSPATGSDLRDALIPLLLQSVRASSHVAVAPMIEVHSPGRSAVCRSPPCGSATSGACPVLGETHPSETGVSNEQNEEALHRLDIGYRAAGIGYGLA